MRIQRELMGTKGTLFGGKLWAQSCCMSAVGLDETCIRAYVREQEHMDKH